MNRNQQFNTEQACSGYVTQPDFHRACILASNTKPHNTTMAKNVHRIDTTQTAQRIREMFRSAQWILLKLVFLWQLLLIHLFIYNLATLIQLQGDIWSKENSFVQQTGEDEMKVAVAYVKTPSSHLPRITVKAEKSSIRTAGDSVRIEPSISNRRARLVKNISDDRYGLPSRKSASCMRHTEAVGIHSYFVLKKIRVQF